MKTVSLKLVKVKSLVGEGQDGSMMRTCPTRHETMSSGGISHLIRTLAVAVYHLLRLGTTASVNLWGTPRLGVVADRTI